MSDWRLHITADKMEIGGFPKSRQDGTSFIRKTLGEMPINENSLNVQSF